MEFPKGMFSDNEMIDAMERLSMARAEVDEIEAELNELCRMQTEESGGDLVFEWKYENISPTNEREGNEPIMVVTSVVARLCVDMNRRGERMFYYTEDDI